MTLPCACGNFENMLTRAGKLSDVLKTESSPVIPCMDLCISTGTNCLLTYLCKNH